VSAGDGSVAGAGGTRHRVAIVSAALIAATMQAIDQTIAIVALPRIQGTLSATQDQMTWVLTSYIVGTAVTMPLGGWLAGRIGRKRVFLASIFGFTVASVMCGIATSLPEMVIDRFLQGVCGAALIPLSQAITLDLAPPGKHAGAMAMWVMGVTAGPIAGPALGGWLTEAYNWRWVFFINLPMGVLAFLGIASLMPETQKRKSSFDWFGFLTLGGAIGSVQLMLDRGQLKDWFHSTEIVVEGSVAIVSLYLFVVHLFTAKGPTFVTPALFRDRNFLTGSAFIFVTGALIFAPMSLYPPLLQDLMNYPVVLNGLVTAPRGVGTLIATLVVTRLAGKIGSRTFIVGGCLLTAYSLWLSTGFYLGMDMYPAIWTGLLHGTGTGLVYVSLAAITFATLSPAHRNEGTAIFSLLRNLGASVGISIVEALFTRNTQILHARLAERVTPFGSGLHGWGRPLPSSGAGLARLNEEVTGQAAMLAYNNDFKLLMVLSLCIIPLVLVMRPRRDAPPPEAVVVE
jgi:MFS transporter, DHA2 family, multidrug resistance protein